MSEKKKSQLGMNPSTASSRLVKDILWNFIEKTGCNSCSKCGKPMSRETFSIEHIIPWLDSDDPVNLYFDLENIGYSHLKCNVESSRRAKIYESEHERVQARNKRRIGTRNYCPEKRRQYYVTKGY